MFVQGNNVNDSDNDGLLQPHNSTDDDSPIPLSGFHPQLSSPSVRSSLSYSDEDVEQKNIPEFNELALGQDSHNNNPTQEDLFVEGIPSSSGSHHDPQRRVPRVISHPRRLPAPRINAPRSTLAVLAPFVREENPVPVLGKCVRQSRNNSPEFLEKDARRSKRNRDIKREENEYLEQVAAARLWDKVAATATHRMVRIWGGPSIETSPPMKRARTSAGQYSYDAFAAEEGQGDLGDVREMPEEEGDDSQLSLLRNGM